jgi:hypothetical protein
VRTQVDRGLTTVSRVDRLLGLNKNLGRHTSSATNSEPSTPSTVTCAACPPACYAAPPLPRSVDKWHHPWSVVPLTFLPPFTKWSSGNSLWLGDLGIHGAWRRSWWVVVAVDDNGRSSEERKMSQCQILLHAHPNTNWYWYSYWILSSNFINIQTITLVLWLISKTTLIWYWRSIQYHASQYRHPNEALSIFSLYQTTLTHNRGRWEGRDTSIPLSLHAFDLSVPLCLDAHAQMRGLLPLHT